MLVVSDRPQVRCTIQFLEISRNDLDQLGATLQGVVGNTGFGNLSGRQGASRAVSTASGTSSLAVAAGNAITNSQGLTQTLGTGVTQFFTLGDRASAYISALVEKRQVRSLAEPTLTMLSGEKASFLAGGEVPVPVSLLNGQISVEFKEFGIRLNLVPTVLEGDRIHLQVAPEVSTVDTTLFVDAGGLNIPGFRTRRMQTTLEMGNRERLVLAGLFNNEDIRVNSRFPGLGNVPVLGAFFRNQNRNNNKNEMIVIIQPEVISKTNGDVVADGQWAPMRSKLETTLKENKAERDENLSRHLLPELDIIRK
jgi:pilus assembly protein CpaC